MPRVETVLFSTIALIVPFPSTMPASFSALVTSKLPMVFWLTVAPLTPPRNNPVALIASAPAVLIEFCVYTRLDPPWGETTPLAKTPLNDLRKELF